MAIEFHRVHAWEDRLKESSKGSSENERYVISAPTIELDRSLLGLIHGNKNRIVTVDLTVLNVEDHENGTRVEASDPYGFKIRLYLHDFDWQCDPFEITRGCTLVANIRKVWNNNTGSYEIKVRVLRETQSTGLSSSKPSLIPKFIPEGTVYEIRSLADVNDFVVKLINKHLEESATQQERHTVIGETQSINPLRSKKISLFLDTETKQVLTTQNLNEEITRHRRKGLRRETMVLWQVGDKSSVAIGEDPTLLAALLHSFSATAREAGLDPRLIGFNTTNFDYPVICEVAPGSLTCFEHVDLIEIISQIPFVRGNLNTLVTLLLGKCLDKGERGSFAQASLDNLSEKQKMYAVSDIEALAQAHDKLQKLRDFARLLESHFRDKRRVRGNEFIPSICRALEAVNNLISLTLSSKLSDRSLALLNDLGISGVTTINELLREIITLEADLSRFRLPDGYSAERFHFYTRPLTPIILQSLAQVIDVERRDEVHRWSVVSPSCESFLINPIEETIAEQIQKIAGKEGSRDNSRDVKPEEEISRCLDLLNTLSDILLFELGRQRGPLFAPNITEFVSRDYVYIPQSIGHLLFVRLFLAQALEHILLENPNLRADDLGHLSQVLRRTIFVWCLEQHGFVEIENPFPELAQKSLLSFVDAFRASVAYGVFLNPGNLIRFKNIHVEDTRVLHAYVEAKKAGTQEFQQGDILVTAEVAQAAEKLVRLMNDGELIFVQGSGKHVLSVLALQSFTGSNLLWVGDDIGYAKLERAIEKLKTSRIELIMAAGIQELISQVDCPNENKIRVFFLQASNFLNLNQLQRVLDSMDGIFFDGYTPHKVKQLLSRSSALGSLPITVLCPYYTEYQAYHHFKNRRSWHQLILSPKTVQNQQVILIYPDIYQVLESDDRAAFATQIVALMRKIRANRLQIDSEERVIEALESDILSIDAGLQNISRIPDPKPGLMLKIIIDPSEDFALKQIVLGDDRYQELTVILTADPVKARTIAQLARRYGNYPKVLVSGRKRDLTRLIAGSLR